MEHSKQANRHLIGRGGIGLVMYHLARFGIDFVETSKGSPVGDIWIFEEGRIIKCIEVKTTKNLNWKIDERQIEKVDFYCFVSMKDSRVWVLSTDELRSLLYGTKPTDGGHYVVARTAMPTGTIDAWQKLTGQKPVRTRMVRRKLANGTFRDYVYAVGPRFPLRFPNSENAGITHSEISDLEA